jgi:hypothetical protein
LTQFQGKTRQNSYLFVLYFSRTVPELDGTDDKVNLPKLLSRPKTKIRFAFILGLRILNEINTVHLCWGIVFHLLGLPKTKVLRQGDKLLNTGGGRLLDYRRNNRAFKNFTLIP